MFEFEYSTPSTQTNSEGHLNLPENWVATEEIDVARPTWWGEHCVECSEPLCFETCVNFERRADGKCRRFKNGIVHNESDAFKDHPYAAEIQFKPWGKLETVIFPGMTDIKKLNDQNMPLLKRAVRLAEEEEDEAGAVSKESYQEIYETGNVHPCDILSDEEIGVTSKFFLFQIYSFNPESWQMSLEITSLQRLMQRRVFDVAPGVNQFLVPLTIGTPNSRTFMYTLDVVMARLVPLNDFDAHVVVLSADFVNPKREFEEKWEEVAGIAGTETETKGGVKTEPAKKVKVVCWDLDNTIWNGTLIEAEPNTLQLRDGIKEIIEKLDNRGIVQMVVSKNQEEDALPELKRLGIDDYFIYKTINWNPKSENIKKIADALNLHLNSFAFIDDQQFEREEVKSAIPCVRTYDENEVQDILASEPFDVPETEDGKNRRKMYQTEARRVKTKTNFSGSNVDFVKSCEMQVSITKPRSTEQIKRSFELLQRTNQLNLSGLKYDKDTFNFLINSTYKNSSYCFFCNDKFGDYGQIGFLTLFKRNGDLEVREFAMSCRVMGKFVENALCDWLLKVARDNSCEKVVFVGRQTDRNKVMIKTLERVGFTSEAINESEINLSLQTSEAIEHADVVQLEDEVSEVVDIPEIEPNTTDFILKQFSDIELLRATVKEKTITLKTAVQEADFVKNSTTFKVGKVVMKLPCAIKRTLCR